SGAVFASGAGAGAAAGGSRRDVAGAAASPAGGASGPAERAAMSSRAAAVDDGARGIASSIGRSHHIRPTSVAAITLANPAATGGRASHDQNPASVSRHGGAACIGNGRVASRAFARIESRSNGGGASVASGA